MTDSATFTTPEASDEEELGEDLGDLLWRFSPFESTSIQFQEVEHSGINRYPVTTASKTHGFD